MERDRAWKLTLGHYFYRGYAGSDINLRWRGSNSDAWLGVYADGEFGNQARTGFDTSIDISHSIQLQPSIQLATRGFFGGSFTVQAGKDWFGLAGIGRTNLRPYFNLNFDPNDAITFGVGHRTMNGSTYSLVVVADDRLRTHQTDWHLNARVPVGRIRATIDVLRKSGLSDIGPITGWGFTATIDWPVWFMRLARDPYQNFSSENAWRISAGIRF
jgi:hypothetical protein